MMNSSDSEKVKVLFRMYSEILEEITVERLWADTIDKEKGLYKLDNLPFYYRNLTTGDIIKAIYDEDEEFLTYKETVEFSNNSTIHIIIMKETLTPKSLCKKLDELGCYYESINEKYFAVEIKEETNYNSIQIEFLKLEQNGEISFAESCLSELHKSQTK